jgi:hypothetical protein
MFPLYLPTMAYQPVDPVPLGRGHWRWSMHWVEANTFQFSDILQRNPPRDDIGRIAVTRSFIEANVGRYASIPTVYFFDEEIARFELEGRFGLTDQTDLWVRLPVQNHTGGFLDPLIEAVHSLGFEQYGRDRVMQNQLTLVVVHSGKILFFNNTKVMGKPQDPVLGITQRWVSEGPWMLSFTASLKPPLTRTYDTYQSGWDQSYGLTGAWLNGGRHAFYFGGAYIRRPHGTQNYNDLLFRDGVGLHATWEYRKWRSVQPFFQLYWESPFLHPQLDTTFDHPSLQHDLGVHWHWSPHTTLSFHYMNNITHNGNTADMSLGATITAHF